VPDKVGHTTPLSGYGQESTLYGIPFVHSHPLPEVFHARDYGSVKTVAAQEKLVCFHRLFRLFLAYLR